MQFSLLAAVALWVSWANLGSAYLADDFGYVARFLEFPWSRWPSLFVSEWSGGIWEIYLPELRPVAALSFMIDAAWWGPDPLGGHLTNLVLHCGCGWLVYLLARRAAPAVAWVPMLAAVLFLLHPTHAEPVAWITGRVDLLGTFFYLGTLVGALAWLENRSWLGLFSAVLSYFAGVFSKEFALTAPLMLLAWMATREKSVWRAQGIRLIAVMTGFFIVFQGYLLCRGVALGSAGQAPILSEMWRQEFRWRLVRYLGWLLPPFKGAGVETTYGHLFAVLGLLGAALALCVRRFYRVTTLVGVEQATLYGIAWGPHVRNVVFFGGVWFLVATVPLVMTYFSLRHLCLASAGTAIALALVVASAAPRRWLAGGLAVAMLATAAWDTREAGRVWMRNGKISQRTSEALIKADAERPPGTAIVLDVPGGLNDAFLWAWATPFALKPPFTPREIGDVYEGPQVYFAWHLWAKDNDWARLAAAERVWLVYMTKERMIERVELDREKVRAAVAVLQASLPNTDQIGVWEKFLTALRPKP